MPAPVHFACLLFLAAMLPSGKSSNAPGIHRGIITNTKVVTTTKDGGPGSLRAAIRYANKHPGTAIVFNIPTSDPGFSKSKGVFTIRMKRPLPSVTANGTVIDGHAAKNSKENGKRKSSSRPPIVINGALAGGASGLVIHAAQCVVRGLVINGFAGNGIQISGPNATGNRVESCYHGVRPVPNASAGIKVNGVRNNVIVPRGK